MEIWILHIFRNDVINLKTIQLTFPSTLPSSLDKNHKKLIGQFHGRVFQFMFCRLHIRQWNLKKRKQDFWSISNSAKIRSPGGNVNKDCSLGTIRNINSYFFQMIG